VIDLILKETNRYDVVSPDLIFLYASTSGSRNAAAVFFLQRNKKRTRQLVSMYWMRSSSKEGTPRLTVSADEQKHTHTNITELEIKVLALLTRTDVILNPIQFDTILI
jgi:hypothetical protein